MPRRAPCLALLAACLLAAPPGAAEPARDKKGVNDKIKEVAGSAPGICTPGRASR